METPANVGASRTVGLWAWTADAFLLSCALLAGALWISFGRYEREPGMIAVGAPYLVAIAWYVSNRLRGRPRGGRAVPALLAMFGVCSGMALAPITYGAPAARQQMARFDLWMLGRCAEEFAADAGRFPISMEEVCTRCCRSHAPLDPWETPYAYEPPASGHPDTWVLRSLGHDRAPGGDAEDADLVVDRNSPPPR